VLHGDYAIKSYERLMIMLDSAKAKGYQIAKISDNSKSTQEIIREQNLFDEKRLLLVEDFDLLNKTDINFINSKADDYDLNLIIYKNAKIAKTKLNKIICIEKEELFEMPKLIWSFLESIYPGNLTNCIKMLQEITKNDALEFVFAMIARQFRDLYWSTLDDVEGDFPSWRLSKLRSQARKFKDGQLKEIISYLAKIDVDTKTGKADLKNELDLLLITQLE
jgi:DNA polymerase III delta subunit